MRRNREEVQSMLLRLKERCALAQDSLAGDASWVLRDVWEEVLARRRGDLGPGDEEVCAHCGAVVLPREAVRCEGCAHRGHDAALGDCRSSGMCCPDDEPWVNGYGYAYLGEEE